jgi:hypothetical protein
MNDNKNETGADYSLNSTFYMNVDGCINKNKPPQFRLIKSEEHSGIM